MTCNVQNAWQVIANCNLTVANTFFKFTLYNAQGEFVFVLLSGTSTMGCIRMLLFSKNMYNNNWIL